MDEPDLRAIESRLEAVADLRLRATRGADGRLGVFASIEGSVTELIVRRDLDRAADGDVDFVGNAWSDIRLLVTAVRSQARPELLELNEIRARAAAASPRPWMAFIESDGGLAGSDVIRVTEEEDQPDMYLWLGSIPAPSRVFRFVAAARQDLPALLSLFPQ